MSRPLIGVALKLAPRRIDVDPLTGAAGPDRVPAGPSAAGLAALEIALQLRDAWQARVLVATVGPAAAEPMLRDALALGASQAVRIRAPLRRSAGVRGTPSALAATAEALAAAVADCPVVLCGDGGHDSGTGAVPALLAARGERAQALGLTRVEPGEEYGTVRAERRLDRGWRERLLVRAPMVLSVESGTARPRRAALASVLAARAATITVLPPSGAALARGGTVPPGTVPSWGTPPDPRGPDSDGPELSGASAACDGPQQGDGALTVLPYRPRARALPPPAGESPLARVLSLLGTGTHRGPAERVDAEPAAAAERILDQLRAWGYL
jgi:electron transfer flavoprotein beta subunit